MNHMLAMGIAVSLSSWAQSVLPVEHIARLTGLSYVCADNLLHWTYSRNQSDRWFKFQYLYYPSGNLLKQMSYTLRLLTRCTPSVRLFLSSYLRPHHTGYSYHQIKKLCE